MEEILSLSNKKMAPECFKAVKSAILRFKELAISRESKVIALVRIDGVMIIF